MEKRFTVADWAQTSNIYEVNIRQYTREGNFAAFEKELPRLRNMGIEILWFMPITPIGFEKRLGTLGSYYACSSYVQINPEYGSLADFQHLVSTAHAMGFKVIIDWVANHTAWDHEWTTTNPDYYKKNAAGNFYEANGWEDVIDLNYENPALCTAMIAAMKYWVQTCDIDGFRCDMAMLVPLEFWRAARTELDAIKQLFWLAECEVIEYHQVFDASYAWQWLHKMEACWKQQTDINGLDALLNYYKDNFPDTAMQALFTTNHDENSHSGSEYERMGEAAEAFAVFCCTWKGLPLIYSGQEMANKQRLKFFDKDCIPWNGRFPLEKLFKKLLLLRKTNPALRAGDPAVKTIRLHSDADKFIFAFIRRYENNEVLVVLNLSSIDKPLISIKDDNLSGNFINLFSSIERDFTSDKYFALRPWEYQVYVKQ